jgi:hypothetical protein
MSSTLLACCSRIDESDFLTSGTGDPSAKGLMKIDQSNGNVETERKHHCTDFDVNIHEYTLQTRQTSQTIQNQHRQHAIPKTPRQCLTFLSQSS